MEFFVIFGELYGFLSCYNWYFYKTLKYMHQHFQKVQFKSAYSNRNKNNIYKTVVIIIIFLYFQEDHKVYIYNRYM